VAWKRREKLRSLEARIVKNEASHDAISKRVWAILFVIIAALINLLAGKITFTGGD